MSVTWVAGGMSTQAIIAYSTDVSGNNWTNSSNASTIFGYRVNAVTHNGLVWVAGGQTNSIAGAVSLGYSYDAITWYASSNGNSILSTVNGVAYGNGLFVAVGTGTNHSIAYSYDGISWTGSASKSFFAGSTNNYGYCVVYKNNTWVAGGTGTSTGELIGNSMDGINWTLINTSGTALSGAVTSIEYDGTRWVAVGCENAYSVGGDAQLSYSTNLINWTLLPHSTSSTYGFGSNGIGSGIEWNGTKLIAVGDNSGPSKDCIHSTSVTTGWAKLANSAFSSLKHCVHYNNVWIIGQDYESSTKKCIIFSSNNGTNWTNCATDPFGTSATATVRAIAYSVTYEGPIYPCFLEGTKILHFNTDSYQDEYIPIQQLRKGDLIATAESGYKCIHSIGYKTIYKPKTDNNPSNRLYKFSKKNCPKVFKPLYITGEHCTLHRKIPEEKRSQITKHMRDVYITEEFYRVPAFMDDRAEPYDGEDKPETIWHFALENDNVSYNYGVYANGLLVESCAIESLEIKSGMNLID